MTVVEPQRSTTDAAPSTTSGRAAAIEIVSAGPMTTVQDVPGRVGYWHVGVPPSGPMDDLSHRLVNRVVGNTAEAAALEITGGGLVVRLLEPATIAVGGAEAPVTMNDAPAATWTPVAVPAGSTVEVGTSTGPGMRRVLAVRGGIDVPPYLGSRSTFTLGRFGGHEGRALADGDILSIGDAVETDPCRLSPGVAPVIGHDWEIGVLIGPHAAPEFLTAEGLDTFLRTVWTVHFNSARTGVRLVGPRPRWARDDGGEAGLHPSNIHDNGYAIGAVDITGDMPVILGPDGPSLGGFVCPAVVATSEQWKLGQLQPGDSVRLVPWAITEAEQAHAQRETWLARATERIEPVARPTWNRRRGPAAPPMSGVLARDDATTNRPEVTYRQAGDRFLLVEFGPMALDLELRLWVHALDSWAHEHLGAGLVDATPGVRSLLLQLDGRHLSPSTALDAVQRACGAMTELATQPFPSRIVHLPLSWDDPATREAIDRYIHGVRPDAPWCPWNIEFIRRINGLESVDDVKRVVFDASYLVLGLGDVYLGAPVATPLDPRHRLVTTKYNPARTWTPENAVGIGGAYLCIYGMEGPGGYQFVGRTVQVWNRDALGPHFTTPWLLRPFDQIHWFEVSADELLVLRHAQQRGELDIKMEDSPFVLADHQRFLADHADSIEAFRKRQQQAFARERQAWADAGEFDEDEAP